MFGYLHQCPNVATWWCGVACIRVKIANKRFRGAPQHALFSNSARRATICSISKYPNPIIVTLKIAMKSAQMIIKPVNKMAECLSISY